MQYEKIDRTETPVVQASFKKYESSRRIRSALFWGTVNLVLAVFAGSEIFYGSFFPTFHIYYPAIWYTELALAVWCSLRFLFEVSFLLVWLVQNPVILTPKQYQLLAVHPRDKRFMPLQNKLSHDEDGQSLTDNSCRTPGISPIIPISAPSKVPSPGSQGSPSAVAMSSLNSFYVTPSGLLDSHYSPGYQCPSPSQMNMSLRNRLMGNTGSPYSPSKFSPVQYNDITMPQDTSTMSRYPSPSTSPFSNDRIKNTSALSSYLQSQEFKMEQLYGDGYSTVSGTTGFMSTSTTNGSPYHWSSYGSHVAYSTPLSVYKIGTRSHLATTSRDEDEFGRMSPQAEELWFKLGTSRQDVDFWTENLRKWISQTVLCKLVKQIEEINTNLQRIGSSELQIGAISLGSLRQVSISKAEHVPTLAAVLPYLELSNNQEYLVKRINELGKDSCMGLYRWKSGSNYRGRSWDQDLPTDAQIVMHVFCTYMDSRLPTDARFPDGRTFTGLYFLKDLNKRESKRRDLAVHRFRQNPPHFKVIVGDEVFDVGQGRNNVFHSIILFLLMVKIRHHGMLGRVNLGPSGVNILGIFNKR